MSRASRAERIRRQWQVPNDGAPNGIDLAADPVRWAQIVEFDEEFIRIEWYEHRLRQRLIRERQERADAATERKAGRKRLKPVA